MTPSISKERSQAAALLLMLRNASCLVCSTHPDWTAQVRQSARWERYRIEQIPNTTLLKDS